MLRTAPTARVIKDRDWRRNRSLPATKTRSRSYGLTRIGEDFKNTRPLVAQSREKKKALQPLRPMRPILNKVRVAVP